MGTNVLTDAEADKLKIMLPPVEVTKFVGAKGDDVERMLREIHESAQSNVARANPDNVTELQLQ